MKTVLRKQHKAKQRHICVINTGMVHSIRFLRRHFSTPWWWRAAVRSLARSCRKQTVSWRCRIWTLTSTDTPVSPLPDPIYIEWLKSNLVSASWPHTLLPSPQMYLPYSFQRHHQLSGTKQQHSRKKRKGKKRKKCKMKSNPQTAQEHKYAFCFQHIPLTRK